LLVMPCLGNSYPESALSSPGGDYMDPLDCDESQINCPACLLQVNRICSKKKSPNLVCCF
jgi:hypothetical protein